MQQITRLSGLLLLVWFALVACTAPTVTGAAQATPAQSPLTTPTSGQAADDRTYIGGVAMVDSVDVRILESFPVQVQVVVQGNLPDGCTEIDEAIVEREGDRFDVTLTTRRPADALCTQAIIPYEQIIPLNVDELPAGEYTVNVNDVTETFTLESSDTAAVATPPAPDAPSDSLALAALAELALAEQLGIDPNAIRIERIEQLPEADTYSIILQAEGQTYQYHGRNGTVTQVADPLPSAETVPPTNTLTTTGAITTIDPLTATDMVTTTTIVTPTGVSSGQFENGVRYRNLAINLDGTFTSTAQLTYPPTAEGPWPTVILFAGSGPYDLDATSSDATGAPLSTNFRLIAEALGEAGIAVLRFNKRGVLGYGQYDMAQVQQASVNQLIADAESVLETAIAQAEVDAAQIFLYGWSEGAQVAANVAANHPELAGLILQAPPNGGLDETLQYQQLEVALPYLREEVDQNDDGQLSREELATIPPGPTWYTTLFYIWARDASPTNPAFQPGLDVNNDELIDIDEELLPVIQAQIPVFAEGYAAVAPAATTAELVAGLEMQVLILQGRRDGWVSFRNAEAIAAAAPGTVTIIIYPNLGHALSPIKEPGADAFGVMAMRPIENVIDWIERVIQQIGE